MIKLFENFNNDNKNLVFLTWYGSKIDNIAENYTYILEKDLGNNCILYNGYLQTSSFSKYARIMTEEEKENWVYNDRKSIAIYSGNSGFLRRTYSQLDKIENCESFKDYESILKSYELKKKEKEIKRLKNIEIHKDIDPYGEEDWEINENYEYDNSGKITKIKINKEDKIDRSDIDPYGEEQWEDHVNIDWSKIKICHPTQYDNGKRVLIIKDTRYYSDDRYNPKDTFGTIDEHGGYSIGVQWNNGEHNSYDWSDLTLIELD